MGKIIKNGIEYAGCGIDVSDVTVDGVSVVNNKVAEIDLSGKADVSSLATVATSGDYDDLSNKPNIYTQTEVDNLLDDKQDISDLLGTLHTVTDCNTAIETGVRYVFKANGTNAPTNAWYVLWCEKLADTNANNLSQFAVLVNTTTPHLWQRSTDMNGNWGSWKEISRDDFLPLTGGTLSGNVRINSEYLVLNHSAPKIEVRNPDFVVDTSSDNGITSTKTTEFTMRDDADYFFSRLYGEADTSGNINTRLQSRNMMTDGNRRTSTIRVSVNKDGNTEFVTAISGGTATYSIASPANFRSAINTTTATLTRASGVSSSVPIADIRRSGNVVTVHFAHLIPAGTYTNLWVATPAPRTQQHAVVGYGSIYTTVTIRTNGIISFNNSMTTTSNSYIIGQLVYLTDE